MTLASLKLLLIILFAIEIGCKLGQIDQPREPITHGQWFFVTPIYALLMYLIWTVKV